MQPKLCTSLLGSPEASGGGVRGGQGTLPAAHHDDLSTLAKPESLHHGRAGDLKGTPRVTDVTVNKKTSGGDKVADFCVPAGRSFVLRRAAQAR